MKRIKLHRVPLFCLLIAGMAMGNPADKLELREFVTEIQFVTALKDVILSADLSREGQRSVESAVRSHVELVEKEMREAAADPRRARRVSTRMRPSHLLETSLAGNALAPDLRLAETALESQRLSFRMALASLRIRRQIETYPAAASPFLDRVEEQMSELLKKLPMKPSPEDRTQAFDEWKRLRAGWDEESRRYGSEFSKAWEQLVSAVSSHAEKSSAQ